MLFTALNNTTTKPLNQNKMTAKEKTLEIINKYLSIDDDIDLFCDECGMSEEAAKLCALIAVDEILSDRLPPYGSKYRYWTEVKNEINNL